VVVLLVLLVPVVLGAFLLAMERLEHELLGTVDAGRRHATGAERVAPDKAHGPTMAGSTSDSRTMDAAHPRGVSA
jgi:hypothetical protein